MGKQFIKNLIYFVLFPFPLLYLLTPSYLFAPPMIRMLTLGFWLAILIAFTFPVIGVLEAFIFKFSLITFILGCIGGPLLFVSFFGRHLFVSYLPFPFNDLDGRMLFLQEAAGCNDFLVKSSIYSSGLAKSSFQSIHFDFYCTGTVVDSICQSNVANDFIPDSVINKLFLVAWRKLQSHIGCIYEKIVKEFILDHI